MWTLQHSGPEGGRAPGAGAEDRAAEEPGARLLCRACHAAISHVDEAFAAGPAGPVQHLMNPHGLVREVLTVRRATNIALVGEATTDFTWFPGTAWRVATCGSCAALLGWRFEATAGGSAPFFGLLLAALVRG